jgi:hypothetical protein
VAGNGVGIGVPAWPNEGGGWAWWFPLLALILIFILPRIVPVQHRRLRMGSAAAALGFLGAWAVDRWGIGTVAAVGGIAAAFLAGATATHRRRGPPPV